MALFPPSALVFSLPQLEESVGHFMLDKFTGDADAERCRELMAAFLDYFKAKARNFNETGETGEMQKKTAIVPTLNTAMSVSMPPSPKLNDKFSSIGRIKFKRTTTIRIKNNKISPMMSQTSTALSVTSPEANQYIENNNKDLDFENDRALQMDNVVQRYTDKEDAMITSGLGLISGMEMKGAIALRDFKTTFSATKLLKGYYNSKEGDIYSMSNFKVRGDVSRVAARVYQLSLQILQSRFWSQQRGST